MSFLVAIGGLAAAIFVLSYMRAGRFGPVVLSIGAGYILAELWTDKLVTIYTQLNADFSLLAWPTATYAGLMLLPGLLALVLSQKRQGFLPRIIAGLAVSLLVVVMLLPSMDSSFVVEAPLRVAYDTLLRYRDIIITLVLVLGVLDIAFGRLPKVGKHHKHDKD